MAVFRHRLRWGQSVIGDCKERFREIEVLGLVWFAHEVWGEEEVMSFIVFHLIQRYLSFERDENMAHERLIIEQIHFKQSIVSKYTCNLDFTLNSQTIGKNSSILQLKYKIASKAKAL